MQTKRKKIRRNYDRIKREIFGAASGALQAHGAEAGVCALLQVREGRQMSELKAEQWLDYAGEPRSCYPKSEADKVIAELEEKRDTAEKLLNKALYCVSNGKNHIMSLARKKNHADYKRCLAMARLAVKDDYAPWNMKWYRRWLELAEKFKEAK